MRGQATRTLLHGVKPRPHSLPGVLDNWTDSFELVDKKVGEDGKVVSFNSALAIVRAFREEFLDRRCRGKEQMPRNPVPSRHVRGWTGWLGEIDEASARIHESLVPEENPAPSTGPLEIMDFCWPGYTLKLIKSEEDVMAIRRGQFLRASRNRAIRLGEAQQEWKGWVGETDPFEAKLENGLMMHFQNLGSDSMRETLGQDQLFEREAQQREHYVPVEPADVDDKPVRSRTTATYEASVRLRRRASLKIFSQMTGQSMEKLKTAALALFEEVPSYLNETQQELLCEQLGVNYKRAPEVLETLEEGRDFRIRSPVVCVMGHVDHGKTTLLDALRRTDVAQGEAGGITQSIGAFTVTHNEQRTTFLDTPGHAAFGAMRARGASKHLTDVIVLVVSVDAGVQVQTRETIRLAQKNNVPLVIAINKCDLDLDPQAIRKQLLLDGVQVESEGGDVLAVNISAKTGEGLDELMEAIDLTAQMLSLRVPFDGHAEAALIELRLVKGAGVVAHGIVRKGTMKVGDYFVCGRKYGKIKQLLDETGKIRIREAPPSTPVGIVGLGMEFEDVFEEDFTAVPTEEIARQLVLEHRIDHSFLEEKKAELLPNGGPDSPQLRVLVKADVHGSVRAFLDYLRSLPTDTIRVDVIKSGLGDVSVADIEYARRLDAHVFGFGVNVVRDAEFEARVGSVPVTCHDVIFHLIDSLKDTLGAMLPPKEDQVLQGFAEVLARIQLNGKGRTKIYCAGCHVRQGQLKAGGTFRVRRDQEVIYEGPLVTLQHFKEKVSVVEKGSECSLSLENFSDFRPGDIIECVTTELRKRVFDDGRGRDGTLRSERHAYA